MKEKFTWKAEVEFNGNEKEFNALLRKLESSPVTVEIPKWVLNDRIDGGWPLPIEELIDIGKQKSLLKTKKHFKAQFNFIDDKAGGIRNAHLHVGDEVIFLDRAMFKELMVEAVGNLVDLRFAEEGVFLEGMR